MCMCVGPEVGGPIRDSIAYIYFERLCFEEVIEGRTPREGIPEVPDPSSLPHSPSQISSPPDQATGPSSSSFPSRSHSLCSDTW